MIETSRWHRALLWVMENGPEPTDTEWEIDARRWKTEKPAEYRRELAKLDKALYDAQGRAAGKTPKADEAKAAAREECIQQVRTFLKACEDGIAEEDF